MATVIKDNVFKEKKSKEEVAREFRRNIKVGYIIRSLHKKQGTMPYLLQSIEPYLTKADRELFGLNF